MEKIRIGTCSWKYPSWKGLVYSQGVGNYLQEYSGKYSTVEIDQWFWSLFPDHSPRLPDLGDVREYRDSVSDDFRFTVKVPNSITLTHYYPKGKSEAGKENPFFLSRDVFNRFMDSLSPMGETLGPLIFQFEYLNRKKMESQEAFERRLTDFRQELPKGISCALEVRNGNFLNERFLGFMLDQQWIPVFLQGYWMPQIVDLWKSMEAGIRSFPSLIFRLHGAGRESIEQETGKIWNRIVTPRDDELKDIAAMVSDLARDGKEIYVNINNHYEGSAPITIERFLGFLDAQKRRG
jgi:uncharacterized protein YecE (DUF72 family)